MDCGRTSSSSCTWSMGADFTALGQRCISCLGCSKVGDVVSCVHMPYIDLGIPPSTCCLCRLAEAGYVHGPTMYVLPDDMETWRSNRCCLTRNGATWTHRIVATSSEAVFFFFLVKNRMNQYAPRNFISPRKTPTCTKVASSGRISLVQGVRELRKAKMPAPWGRG
jgi:hypothetical protein